MDKTSHFEAMAAQRLPGVLYSFNIADLKRRNSHLGHLRGDEDVKAFDAALRASSPKDAVVGRIDGARWLMLCPRSENDLVQALLERYHRSEPLTVGWRIDARRDAVRKTASAQIDSAISRSVRCLYVDVRNAEALGPAILALCDNDYGLPVGRPLYLPDVARLARQPWRCVSRYPDHDPACPFCGGTRFEWTDGDGAVYSGDGVCQDCGAEVSISQFDEQTIPEAV
ncbi:MAG: diguanylate cyclase [Bradyrhizobiaceae bacterium]|nr:diguanylate cyclase [Bradyrhizobiaceae bacterium]